MQQLKISLSDEIRDQLDAASAKAEHSLGEEIRRRLQTSFDDEALDPETRRLAAAIGNLAVLVKLQTGRVLRHALTARLARLKPEGEPVFGSGELPIARLVASGSDDPEAMGLGLEAVDFHTPPMTAERRRQIDANKGDKS